MAHQNHKKIWSTEKQVGKNRATNNNIATGAAATITTLMPCSRTEN